MNENNLAKVDLNLLKSLRALIEERHVGRAAQKMNVSQSAMSHTLARLRGVFDDSLFIRNAKGLEPTARAIELSDKLRFILREIDSLLAPKTLELSHIHAHFRIQTHDFILASYLSKAFKRINHEAPNILIDIKILDETAYDKLDDGELEMIIGAGLQAKPRFMQKRLTDENLVCLLDKGNPVLKNWTPETIFRYPHIKSSLLDDRDDPVSKYGKAMGLPKRKIGFLAETLNFQLPLLSDSDLIAFLPDSIAKKGSQVYGLVVKECPFPLPPLTIRAMWHERHQNDVVHQWIREKIEDVFTDATS
ncbi:transcriptional regulator [Shewanella sediminis HAW-EB3]|uniref:Transcriptional regulator n=1 Tax=Shewanella sediminis (strain HAW-EB3) TaxID=425104 RepID=A8FU12_SHESH|nr:LysR substrate-binding domain-containing protein [Shewanella sediminis]ABV36335.1 transcriptional regulator [Shewanella sediminis HAW-EB3]